MKPANSRILTINGGSSSIKFALFEAGDSLQRILEGGIERIGLPGATLRVKGVKAVAEEIEVKLPFDVKHSDDDIARVRFDRFAQAANADAERAEMHGDMGGIGDELAVGIEQGAGEVQPLLDVGGKGRALQYRAHLFRDRHEEIIKYL